MRITTLGVIGSQPLAVVSVNVIQKENKLDVRQVGLT